MATSEMLFIPTCEEVDNLFREAREYYNDLFVKKMAVNSVFYHRVEVRDWPMNTAPEMKGFRFGRGWYNPDSPWQKVVANRCGQNSCDKEFEQLSRPGSESYTWSELVKRYRTEWYCLEDWMRRLFPAEEIDHIMATNAQISRNVHEEFARSNWVLGSGHKWAAISNEDSLLSCDSLDDQMWEMREFDGAGQGGPDARFIYVKLPAADLPKISLLSYDQLDEILQLLQREDDAYRLDVSAAAGRPLLEVILPDPRVNRSLWKGIKESGLWAGANTDFDDKMLQYSLGIDRVIGNYAFAYDINGLRYNIDYAYNAGLPPFDASNPETWPRLRRVHPYIPVPTEIGCKWVQNPAYRKADFGITIPWVNNQMVKWMPPGFSGYGEAQGQVQNYAGEWIWENPPWECNIERTSGFFRAKFRMSMQIKDPTMMHSILHRLDNSRLIQPACCDVNPQTAPDENPDCFACEGVITDGEGEE